jgi:glycosidase
MIKMKKFWPKISLIIILSFLSYRVNSQTTSLAPNNVTSEQLGTLTFNATGTSLAGESKIYVHAGVVTTSTNSPGSGDWQYVKGNWGKDDGVGLMTAVVGQTNKWQISLSPTIRQYFSVPNGTNIYYLALVFRNATGTKQTSPDIFLPLLSVSITSPKSTDVYFPSGGSITISGAVSQTASSMEILVDTGVGFSSIAAASNTTNISTTYTPASSSATIKIKATVNSNDLETFSTYNFVTRPDVVTESLPAGMKDGINYSSDPTNATLVLLAPQKEFCYLVGDFTNWLRDDNYFMKQTPDGERFWFELSGLTSGKEYVFQYWVDGTIKIGDPLADKVADPYNDSSIPSTTYPNLPSYNKTDNGIATVLQTNQTAFTWESSEDEWQAPEKDNLIIYELLLRDFIGSRKYKDLADTLGYFKRLGINAIELMPIMEFEGNLSWGYNPSYFLAPDKFYGTKDDLKYLVQEAHKNGIAIIMDMVLNHAFGQNAMVQMYFDKAAGKPSLDNPWFNRDATHPYSVGYDFNHESPYTKDFVDTVCSYWLKEYHVDGFRFDLSKGFTQKNNPNDVGAWGAYDASRINILTRMADKIWQVKPNAYVILEHFADGNEEAALATNGMLLWGNMNNTYYSALNGITDANLSQASRLSYVNYMESHDEERIMANLIKNGASQGSYDLHDLDISLNRMKMGAAFFYTLPGPKMLWQFGELGYDKSINYCTNGTESDACRLDNKPLPWGTGSLNYYSNSDRQRLFSTITQLNKLVSQNKETFKNGTIQVGGTGNVRTITIKSSAMDVVIVGNFTLKHLNVALTFTKAGTWFDYFGNESFSISDVNQTRLMAPGEFHIYTTTQQEAPPSGLIDFIVTGVKESNISFSIYPNPTSGKSFTIQLDEPQKSDINIRIFDLYGRVLKDTKLQTVSNKLEYEHNLSSGLYLIELNSSYGRNVKKIIIE